LKSRLKRPCSMSGCRSVAGRLFHIVSVPQPRSSCLPVVINRRISVCFLGQMLSMPLLCRRDQHPLERLAKNFYRGTHTADRYTPDHCLVPYISTSLPANVVQSSEIRQHRLYCMMTTPTTTTMTKTKCDTTTE